MWCSFSESAQEERARGADEKRLRDDENNDDDDDNDDEFVKDNVDSGFLSAGNMQVSNEIRESCVSQLRQEDNWRINEGVTSTSGETSSVSPLSVVAIVDSGVVDVDLNEGLNQLILQKQPVQLPGLNPLAIASGVQSEPTAIFELMPVKTGSKSNQRLRQHLRDDLLLKEHQQEDVKKCAIINESIWQLYYMQDDDGDTQLHIAIMQGYVEAALILIRLAPHPYLLNIYNDDWQSSLHLAVLTNQSLIVRRLILAGADPSLRNFHGNTALHLACMNGDLACAKALTDPLSPMERNNLIPGQIVPALPQNLEQRNYSGEMCLHLAATNGHVNLVRLLLRLGADLEAREALAGKTALHLAMERKCRSVVNFLLQECKPCLDTQMYNGLTAYQLAMCIDIQFARELVRYGAKPEPLLDSDSDLESNSEDETYGETSYLSAIIKMQNAVELKV
ncbi:NF-kappa-B inhibitor cactus [Trachymyrmex septentrionalis]|uniref:NF-kappa-B inhibitor cactus n=1 Tax=Trachymyrmex septentrionalis TaxID=34720 RepID=A0A195FQ41_9HYME|nr:PREDICTED: NF-kappa-B inhibitor cactus-like isoform X2 [Trachymyrmex septentrionalis]KYN42039.1 NF-kappa-B inhibitor cactus [Trachymyrmex septentrionalis]